MPVAINFVESRKWHCSRGRSGSIRSGAAGPFLVRLHVYRLEVKLAVEVHEDGAVAALFALVIMDLSRRLRPHRSRPACLRCCFP